MRPLSAVALLVAGMVAGCMAAGPVTTAQTPAPAGQPGAPELRGSPCAPLVLDRSDLALGLTVQFSRIPTPIEIEDLRQTPSLMHVLIALSEWPPDYEAIMGLGALPQEIDLTVLLPGYPPSRQAADVWNLVPARLRLVLLVQGPPPTPAMVADLNGMRGLERVIQETDRPSRAGFERLQRPLSFRQIVP